MSEVIEALGRAGLIPVIKVSRAEDALLLGRALSDGELAVAEITFRTAAAAEAIRRLTRELPTMLVGAGTVLNVEQAAVAVEAGARFIVAPGLDLDVVGWCLQRGVAVLPGVATATEIMAALRAGVDVLKYFPARELGGAAMLKALAGPFPNVRFIPTGGIDPHNLSDYLRLPNVLAVGGGWLAPATLVAEGRFDEITRLAQEGRRSVNSIRAAEEVAR